MNNLPGMKILRSFEYKDIAKSALTALIFYVLIGGIIIVPTIMISLLYVPFMIYFMLGIFVVLSFNSSFGLKIFTETLQNYDKSQDIEYETFITRTSVILAMITFAVIAFIYIQYLE